MKRLAYVDHAIEGCRSGKAVFENRRAAATALKRGHRGAKGLRPYKCPDCPYWHLSHPGSRKGPK